MAVWLLTATCFAVLVQYALARWGSLRRRRRGGAGRMVSGMCIYLNEARVESIAAILGIPKSDIVEISETSNVGGGVGVSGRFGAGSGEARRDASRETSTSYSEQNTPMKTIRLIMVKMRERDIVVDADLTSGHLLPNAALAETLRDAEGGQEAPLTAVRSDYVSVSGLFTVRRADGGDVVLRARYGSSEPAAQVKITCEEAWGRPEFRVDRYSDGEFPATCLGLVRTWNGATGELTLDPVSIFR
ncbi:MULTISPECIES: hypothetical protein [Streptomyces]|uniref:Uncharacterized protein n=1 Tax=Streptomyces dengpaensis TaxID=2049881 RepID=A0ABN5I790_9ACTN|nr:MULTISPECIES: hypothetical protein [Streptomyces]AVH59011.1 hypothetical protein C4B68_28305 [Streptomyces dengpaensis]PIB05939.1 hypothetical protein B1C81_26840 [Streptomyces sp. HG99]